MGQQQKILTFWDHLEELRHVLFRIAVAVVFLMLVAFLFKDELFAIVLAPKNADFIIYHFFWLMPWPCLPYARKSFM